VVARRAETPPANFAETPAPAAVSNELKSGAPAEANTASKTQPAGQKSADAARLEPRPEPVPLPEEG
jgi:hypothetical protein